MVRIWLSHLGVAAYGFHGFAANDANADARANGAEADCECFCDIGGVKSFHI